MDSWLTEVNDDKPMKMSLQQRMRGNQSENSNDIIMIATMDFRLMEMKKNPRPQCVICCEVIAIESMHQSKLLWQIDRKHLDLINQSLLVDHTQLKHSLYRTDCT